MHGLHVLAGQSDVVVTTHGFAKIRTPRERPRHSSERVPSHGKLQYGAEDLWVTGAKVGTFVLLSQLISYLPQQSNKEKRLLIS